MTCLYPTAHSESNKGRECSPLQLLIGLLSQHSNLRLYLHILSSVRPLLFISTSPSPLGSGFSQT
jgi:hypothetical protein